MNPADVRPKESPTGLGDYQQSPLLWYCKRVLRWQSEIAPVKMWRGKAVEAGLVYAAHHKCELSDAVTEAEMVFDIESDHSKEAEEEKKAVAKYVAAGYEYFARLDIVSTQQKHVLDFGLPIVLRGFSDLETADEIHEIKSTERMPRSAETISPGHKYQAACYGTAAGKPCRLSYVSPKGELVQYVLSEEIIADTLAEMQHTLRAICKTIEVAKDEKDLLEFLSPQFASFYWDADLRHKARRLIA